MTGFPMQDESVCIFGMGYVGLTLAVALAERGIAVTGLEIDDEILGQLRVGKAHFYESGLEVRMSRMTRSGKLAFHGRARDVRWDMRPTAFIITVGTPLDAAGAPRMDMVESVATEVGEIMPHDALVVLRSTVRLGTSRNVVLPILRQTGRRFQLAYCPERTIEGKALEELAYLPQIIGALDERALWRASQLFQRLTPTVVRVSSLEAAEIIKLLDNSFRDVFFALGNEVAQLCDATGLDGIEVIRAANTGYERTDIALPGFVGGPCLQKDPRILAVSLADVGHVASIIRTARDVNEALPGLVVRQIINEVPRASLPEHPRISVLGVAFKGRPDNTDIRGTPVIQLISALQQAFPGADLRGQDFLVPPNAIASLGLRPVTMEEAFKGAHVVVVANNNTRYQWVDIDALAAEMDRPGVIFDAWSVLPLDPATQYDGVLVRRLGSVSAWRGKI